MLSKKVRPVELGIGQAAFQEAAPLAHRPGEIAKSVRTQCIKTIRKLRGGYASAQLVKRMEPAHFGHARVEVPLSEVREVVDDIDEGLVNVALPERQT